MKYFLDRKLKVAGEGEKPAENELEIHVANSLMNRMILDSQLPVEKRITYSYPEIASPKDALIPSGIIKGVDIIYKK